MIPRSITLLYFKAGEKEVLFSFMADVLRESFSCPGDGVLKGEGGDWSLLPPGDERSVTGILLGWLNSTAGLY